AREGAASSRGAPSAHVELLQQACRPAQPATRVQPAEARERLLAVVVEDEVLGEVEVEDETAPVPVLGHVAQPGIERFPRGGVRQVASADGDVPARDTPKSRQCIDELAL